MPRCSKILKSSIQMAIIEGKDHNKKQKSARMKDGADYFANIPDDLLLCILNFLPHNILEETVMYVCKRWSNLITQNIFFSHASLILQKPINGKDRAYTSRLVSMCDGRKKLKLSKKDLDIPCQGFVRSWCNELLLVVDPIKLGALYVYNLITKEGLCIPSSESDLCKGHIRCRCGLSLGFDKFTTVYKVVHVYIGLTQMESEIIEFKYESSRYTFSNWVKIEGPEWRGKREYYWDDPVCVDGRFLHWDVHSPEYIVSMDIIKGEFQKTPLPRSSRFPKTNGYYLLEISGLLSVVVPFPGSVFDIWIMTDFEKSKWDNLATVRDSSPLASEIRDSGGKVLLTPLVTLRNGSNMIFRKGGSNPSLYSYKVFKDGSNSMTKLDVPIEASERCVVQSKDGLWMLRLDEV